MFPLARFGYVPGKFDAKPGPYNFQQRNHSMAVYMIGYDLNRPGQNYPDLIKALETYSTRWHCLDSTWLVVSNETSIQIRDKLSRHIDSTDELLVAFMGHGNAAWVGFNNQCSTWLTNQLS
jgi:hypothetical protein